MALYRKNITRAQQIVRLAVGLGGAAAAFLMLAGPLSYVGIAGGVMFAVTGLVGYCPMCAIAGLGQSR